MDKDGESEDYVWSFRLDGSGSPSVEPDPMVEMIRVFLADFLQIGSLTKNGVRMDADGFVFTADPETVHKIFSDKS